MSESTHEKELEAILHAYLQAVDAGQDPNREELLRRHPDLAAELREFFADQSSVDRMAKALNQGHADAITIGVEETSNTADGLPRIRYFGDYELVEEIARGGMGVVYKARQVSLNRIVALKMILAGELATPADVQRFHQEAEAAANLDHPNIVPIYEVGEFEGHHYFSMKFIEGGSLSRAVRANRSESKPGPLAWQPEVARLLATVARAVHHAHQRGILHRDLKPANILLEQTANEGSAVPMVTDFGLAKHVETDSGQTRSGAIVGTPSYMSPEQARSEKVLSTAVDVYGLGAILYELLTGRPPFRGETTLQTLMQVLETEPEPPSSVNRSGVNRGIDRDLETICLKCLDKDPAGRYGSAELLAQDLEHWLRGEPIAARPAGVAEKTVKWMRRRPAVASLLAAVLFVTVVGFAAFAWSFEQTRQARDLAVAEQLTTAQALQDTEKARKQADSDREQAEADRQKAEDQKRIADEARAQAEVDRQKADDQKRIADKARQEAETATIQKDKQMTRAESLLYYLQFSTAHDFFLNGDMRKCRTVLAECRPDYRGPEHGYLANRLEKTMRVFPTDAPYSMVLSADGKRLFTGGRDSTIRMWDLEMGKQTLTLRGHEGIVVWSLVLGADGKRLFSLSGRVDAEVKVWDVDTGKEIRTISTKGLGVSLALSADGKLLFFGNNFENKIQSWDVETGAERPALIGFRGVKNLTLSKDGKRLCSLDHFDKKIMVWDLETGKATLTLPGDSSNCMVLSADGKRLYSGTRNGIIEVWDLETGKLTPALFVHKSSVTSLALTGDGKRLFSGSSDNTIKLWDLETGREIHTLSGHTRGIKILALSANGKRLASTADDQTIIAWDLESGNGALTLPNQTPISSLALNVDGKEVFAGGHDGTIRGWDVATGKETRVLRDRCVTCLALTFDGKRLFSGNNVNDIKEWDLETDKEIRTLSGHAESVSSLALSPDGKRLFSGSRNDLKIQYGVIKEWDLETGKELLTLSGHSGQVTCLVLSADGKRLFSGSAGHVKVWDLEAGKKMIPIFYNARFAVTSVAVSADGKRLFMVAFDSIQIWDLETRKKTLTLSGHKSLVTSLALSANGKRLFSASRDNTIKVWDLETGKELLALLGHTGWVTSLALSADGKRLVSGSMDQTIKVWDLGVGSGP